jgi:hypothetical protein
MKIPRSVLSLLSILSLAGFCLGFVLHALTYFGIDPGSSVPTTFPLSARGSSHPITKAEFIKYSAYWARMTSSHWMAVCSLIAMEFYDYLRRRVLKLTG